MYCTTKKRSRDEGDVVEHVEPAIERPQKKKKVRLQLHYMEFTPGYDAPSLKRGNNGGVDPTRSAKRQCKPVWEYFDDGLADAAIDADLTRINAEVAAKIAPTSIESSEGNVESMLITLTVTNAESTVETTEVTPTVTIPLQSIVDHTPITPTITTVEMKVENTSTPIAHAAPEKAIKVNTTPVTSATEQNAEASSTPPTTLTTIIPIEQSAAYQELLAKSQELQSQLVAASTPKVETRVEDSSKFKGLSRLYKKQTEEIAKLKTKAELTKKEKNDTLKKQRDLLLAEAQAVVDGLNNDVANLTNARNTLMKDHNKAKAANGRVAAVVGNLNTEVSDLTSQRNNLAAQLQTATVINGQVATDANNLQLTISANTNLGNQLSQVNGAVATLNSRIEELEKDVQKRKEDVRKRDVVIKPFLETFNLKFEEFAHEHVLTDAITEDIYQRSQRAKNEGHESGKAEGEKIGYERGQNDMKNTYDQEVNRIKTEKNTAESRLYHLFRTVSVKALFEAGYQRDDFCP